MDETEKEFEIRKAKEQFDREDKKKPKPLATPNEWESKFERNRG